MGTTAPFSRLPRQAIQVQSVGRATPIATSEFGFNGAFARAHGPVQAESANRRLLGKRSRGTTSTGGILGRAAPAEGAGTGWEIRSCARAHFHGFRVPVNRLPDIIRHVSALAGMPRAVRERKQGCRSSIYRFWTDFRLRSRWSAFHSSTAGLLDPVLNDDSLAVDTEKVQAARRFVDPR